MWPRQASLIEGLPTPPLFRQWCNIKVIFKRTLGRKAPGMMGMLRQAGIAHVGHHHLGIDDVRNLCNLVLWLLDHGAEFVPTFTAQHRLQEYHRRRKKVKRQAQARSHKLNDLQRLPASTEPAVRARMSATLARMEEDIVRLKRMANVFA